MILMLVVSIYIQHLPTANALINDPVSTRTFLNTYNPNLSYKHAYFDISFTDGSPLVQVDLVGSYSVSRLSSLSYNYFQYIETYHVNQTSRIIYPNIYLEGHHVYGMCVHDGELDYLVIIEDNSNDIKVVRLTYNPSTEVSSIRDYKIVDKADNLWLDGNIYVDCHYTGQYRGDNTYVIGILGKYYDSNDISNYYLAKFNTKYNLTEYQVESGDTETMEIPRRVRVDEGNQKIYIAIEINKNKYNGQTVYTPGSLPGNDNSNVAVICYDWSYGTRLWTTLVGDPTYSDSVADLEYYSNYVYLITNSFTTTYSTNSSQTDMIMARMRTESGLVDFNQTIGSPLTDTAYDLEINYQGIFLLALIQGPLLPHRNPQYQWQTLNNGPTIGIIRMTFDCIILDVEGYAIASTTTPSPYPTRIFSVANSSSELMTFMFASHRSNLAVDNGGGLLITYINDSTAIFTNPSLACATSCSRCSEKDTTQCILCKSGYVLFENQCYATSCPQFSYQIIDETGKSQPYCKRCHYSCKTCLGPRKDQCSSCCTNGVCGPIYDRKPNLGQCTCPAGSTESQGICTNLCNTNFAARLNQMCYQQCPTNSYPDLVYDQNPAQESTEYDPAVAGTCLAYQSHLQFNKNGKGIAILGPDNLESIPEEFTLGIWVMPSVLNPNSYLVNLFGRIQVYAVSSNNYVFYKFITGATTSISPTYVAANQALAINSWNYVTVSQRVIQIGTTLNYEIQLGIAQGNFGTLNSAGYTNTGSYTAFSFFVPYMYLGAYSDSNPQSFTGYLREFRFFSIFHGIYQMQNEAQRLYRLYSYDDPQLIAYWKLDEGYPTNTLQYTLHDYSINQNTMTYSTNSDPLYPVFYKDTSLVLSLCYYHDVKTCRTVDYSSVPPIGAANIRYLSPPTFTLNDFTLTQALYDQIYYLPANTDCNQTDEALAYINYTAQGWEVVDDNFNTLYLKEATHYQLCYYIFAYDTLFNLAQIYIAGQPRTIDPSSGTIYNRTDTVMQWMTGYGDQAHGDMIRFSYDCQNPVFNETTIMRTSNPDYPILTIYTSFNVTGKFYFCWYPVFMQDQYSYPMYEPIHSLQYVVQYEPQIKSTFITQASTNENMIMLNIEGTFVDGDQFTAAWSGMVPSDCNPDNYIGQVYTYNHSAWPGIWIGYQTGVYGILNVSMDTLQFCWKPGATGAPSVFIRMKKEDLTAYFLRVVNFATPSNIRAPELLSFDPEYGSCTLTALDNVIRFNFKQEAVIPCSNGAGVMGQIIIYRGAVKSDGSFVKTNQILWSNTNLYEGTQPDPFQQGDLICSQTGQCSINLNQNQNKMKAGEIYYLSFFSYSFMTMYGGVPYYLFNTALPVGTVGYDHLFMCRSYNITSNNGLINGDTIVMQGEDLLYQNINAKYVGGTLVTDIFYTKAINLVLKIYNTDNFFCVNYNPTATVAMEDVTSTQFTIRNLNLKQCNDGDLFADIELVRGVRDQYGYFSFLRSEKMYNVQLGTIGCDPSCSVCNGTSANNCEVCSNATYFLFNGTCSAKCPSIAPYQSSVSLIFQSNQITQPTCLYACPPGYYSDPLTNICTACNSDCLTCNNANAQSCTSCQPVMQLYNGICLQDCPSPHHQNNYTSYVCDQISSTTYLKVNIMNTGYIKSIPKEASTYLIANINNTGGGTIASILWTQIEPNTGDPDYQVLSADPDGTHNVFSSIVRLSNNAMMKISSSQVIKIQVTVTNSIGEIAYDIIEFFLNDSPVIGNTTITILNEPSTSTGTSMTSQFQIQLTGWYDSSDDPYQMLKFKVVAIKTYQVGLNLMIEQYTLTGQFNDSEITLPMPPFSIDKNSISYYQNTGDGTVPDFYYQNNITLCVQAYDVDFALSQQCFNYINMSTNVNYIYNYSTTIAYIQSLNLSDIMDIMFASNMIYQVVQTPLRPNTQFGICTMDFHCNFNGVCDTGTGISKCNCNQGYFGTYCDFQANEFQAFKDIVSTMVTNVLSYLNAKGELDPFDIEIVANLVRGSLGNQDLVQDSSFNDIVSLLNLVSSSSFYSFMPIDINTTTIIYQAYNNAFQKINHSFKVRKAEKDTTMLGLGATLSQYTNDFQISGSNFNLSQIMSQPYFISDANKPYLIGGLRTNSSQRRQLFMSQSELQMYQSWVRSVDSSLNEVIQMTLLKLNPLTNQFSVIFQSFEIMLTHGKPSSFIGRDYIQSKSAYWDFPSSIWANQPGVTTIYHEIRQTLMRYIINPFSFEEQPKALLEGNITSVTYYSVANIEIPVNITKPGQYVDYREPFNTTMGYNPEQLRCMAWNEFTNSFNDDNTCTFQTIYEIIPCPECNIYTQINSSVSLCRCTHLTRFGVVYEETNVTDAIGSNHPSIYSNFFSMQYWSKSFGFYLTIAGVAMFSVGHLFIWFIDARLQNNLIVKLREKTRRFEVEHGAEFQRSDGLFMSKKGGQSLGLKGKVKSRKKIYKGEDTQEEDDNQYSLVHDNTASDMPEEFKDDQKLEAKKKRRKSRVVRAGKSFKEAQHEGGASDEEDEKDQLELEELADNADFERGQFDQNDKAIMKKLAKDKRRRKIKKLYNDDYEYEDEQELEDSSKMSEEQKANFQKNKELMARLKKKMTPQESYHALMGLKYNDIQGFTKKQFRRRIIPLYKRVPKQNHNDVKEYLEDLRGELYSTDEDAFNHLKELFEKLRLQRESHLFQFKNMIVHGSFLLSIFYVTSLLSPRHIRWSLFFSNIAMLWFICAVFFTHTKDPLEVPDFSTGASSLAFQEIWISFIAPWGSIILMYVLSSFLKMPNSQLLNVVTLRQLEASLIEFRQEQFIRFFMGYIIVFVIMVVVFWYSIQFTAAYGWKVSWTWFYAGIVAIFLQMAIIDHLFSVANWGLYRFNRRLGRLFHKIRSVTQAYNETYENSDEELMKFRSKQMSQSLKISKDLSKVGLQDDDAKDFSIKIDEGSATDKVNMADDVTQVDNEIPNNPITKRKKRSLAKKK